MKNEYVIDGDICFVKLTQGQWALIDVDQMELVGEHRWHASSNKSGFYAKANIKGRRTTLSMHRLILGFPERKYIDHKSHNTLDNRNDNIRIVTPSENNLNRKLNKGYSSMYPGICHIKTRKNLRKKWWASIVISRKLIYGKFFLTEREAVITRARVFVELFGKERNPQQTLLATESEKVA